MITHYIILSSSYSIGKRIAVDYILTNKESYCNLKDIVPKIIEKCGSDVSISTHSIQTENKTWQSVVEKDQFFKDVEVITSLEKFIKLIVNDRHLKGIDIAKYILSKIDCTHLKLEKLVYLCYAEYLCKTDKKLFEDKIFAYKYGPVVGSVYNVYKEYGKDTITSKVEEMPSKSRILFAKDGLEKIDIIDKTINKYGKYTASQLVTLTHKENTPWSKTINQIFSKNIKDCTIKKYHKFEEI